MAEQIGEATLNDLSRWLIHEYEHLGWMTLAQLHNNDEKVLAYFNSINKLKRTIQSRLNDIPEGRDIEIKRDLVTMLGKADNLITVANKLFDEKSIKHAVCTKCKADISDESTTHIFANSMNGLRKYNQSGGKSRSKKASKNSSKKKTKKTSKKMSKKSK